MSADVPGERTSWPGRGRFARGGRASRGGRGRGPSDPNGEGTDRPAGGELLDAPAPDAGAPSGRGQAAVLSVRDLRVTFESSQHAEPLSAVEAVRGVDFAVAAGRTLAVVGESGSGKSASLLGLAGLLPSSARVTGEVHFAGRDLLTVSRRELRRILGRDIGFVFQDPSSSLHPHKTVGGQVEEALRLHARMPRSARRARVLELFDRVGIRQPRRAFEAYPGEYSGGMKQRVSIAMAIANRPQLIVADEPTTALDATVQASIIALLRDLQRQDGTALIFVNHDLAVVHQIADDVVVMRGGRIVERGDRDRIYGDPAHEYTKQLLAASGLHAVERVLVESVPARTPTVGAPVDTPGGIASAEREAVAVLQVRDLTKSYRQARRQRQVAVDKVTFEVGRGEILALVGESGSGKSTIGKVVAGLLSADSGSVRVLGEPLPVGISDGVPSLPAARRQAVQMIFQDAYSSLNPRRSARASILAPLISRRIPRAQAEKRLEEVLRRTGISPELLGRYPGHLSGGQRQRVAIARALMLRPALIVADEALAALDVTAQAEIIDVIRSMRTQDGTSFLFITHDLGVASHLADRVIVLGPDGVADTGTPAQVFRSPTSDYTRRLVAAVPRIPSRVS